jgi:hypothetical protein
MPEERDIEKALRARAQRRREDAGAPVELHPATRKMFQAEISRLKGSPRQSPGLLARLLWGSPLRLVLNFSAIAVLLVAAALLPPLLRRHSTNLSAGATPLAANQRELDVGVQPSRAASDNLVESRNAPAVELQQRVAKAVAGESTPTALADNVNMNLDKTPVASAAPGVEPPLPTAAPPSTDEEKLEESKTKASGMPAAPASLTANAIVQSFSWLNVTADKDERDRLAAKLGVAPALTSFRTEQSGDNFRVIDADGSVYIGSVTLADKKRAVDGTLAPAQARSFRVSGTNLTRRQPVVFTGNLVVDDQSESNGNALASGTIVVGGGFGGGGFASAGTNPPAPETPLASAPGAAQSASITGTPPQPPRFRLEGRAFIGTNEIEINAMPASH